MEDAGREIAGRRVGRGEAEDVGVADGLGAKTGAKRVSNDPAEAGVCAAVGLDRARAIVGFDFEGDVVVVVEFDDAGVVAEDADAPIVVAERLSDLLRGGEDRFFEQVVELLRSVFVGVSDAAG